jgi:stage V sporulation protein SpoVS
MPLTRAHVAGANTALATGHRIVNRAIEELSTARAAVDLQGLRAIIVAAFASSGIHTPRQWSARIASASFNAPAARPARDRAVR